MKKIITIGVILLFIFLTSGSVINAETTIKSNIKKPLEITTQIHSLYGVQEQIVTISTEESKQIDILFDKLEKDLNVAKSKSETIEIFEDAIEKLYELGLLGDINVDDAKRIVTGRYENTALKHIIEKVYSENMLGDSVNENFNCLIAGKTSDTYFCLPIARIAEVGSFLIYLFLESIDDMVPFGKILDFIKNTILFFPFALAWVYGQLANIIPVSFANTVGLGYTTDPLIWFPAEGWLWSLGLTGIKKWEGKMLGDLSLIMMPAQFLYGYSMPAISGFTGINIYFNYRDNEHFYLGYGFHVKIMDKN